jgi:hypothetical protein
MLLYTRKVEPRPPLRKSRHEKSGLEITIKRDRRFFARHPVLLEHLREIMPGEFLPSEIPPGCEAHGRIIVRQIARGFRARQFDPDLFFFVMERQR